MPVKISGFQPASPERIEELRRSKGRQAGDPVMQELLDAVEAGQPQDVRLGTDQNGLAVRIAIARAAGKRGLLVETFEWCDQDGVPYVTVAKREEVPARQKAPQAQPSGNGRRRGRPRKQDTAVQATDNYAEPRTVDGMSEVME